MKFCQEGVDNLRCAIVERAAMDYLDYRKKLYKIDNYGRVYHDKDRDYFAHRLEEVINFFKGEWYRRLVDIDGSYLVSKLDVEFEAWKIEYDREKRKKKNRKVKVKAG